MDAIVISDIHIGAGNCQAKQLVDFLEKVHTQEILTKRLILNGDVFQDFDSRLHTWNWKILSSLRSISDLVELVWIKGNHDVHGPALPIAHLIGAQYYEDDYVFESGEKKVLCFHGDVYDDFLTDHPLLTYIADWIYWILQRVDGSFYLAKIAKHNSKTFLRCVERIEKMALKHMKKLDCDIVCCGHTHLAVSNEPYFNSGTWTELPPTYLTVDNGKVELKTWISESTES
jgi:UDP-2,3-diacylglucosamine pyrophosphatase LpxH